MKIRIATVLLILVLGTSLEPARAATGVFLDVRVEEGAAGESSAFEPIDQRQIELLSGVEKASFQANFTLTTTATVLDSENVLLNLSLITLPPKPQTIFREVLAKNNQTIFLDEIKVKQNRVFRVYLTPGMVDVPVPECDLDTRDKESEDWEELPSAHFFFRYILNSLADLHWSEIKGYAEGEYRRFRETFGFTRPAMDRMEYFLLPCRPGEVTWDKRFDMGLDPVRNKLYAVYNLFERSLDSPGVGFLLFYRSWGYAPPMLAEGVGGYFSLSHHFTKKIIASKRRVPLRQLVATADYRKQSTDVAFWESCSFVRFLISAYTQEKFRTLYQKATDLTLETSIREIYGKDLQTLETEWLSFLEEYRDTISDFYYLANVKMKNVRLDEAVELYRDMLDLYGRDVGILRSLAYAYYLKGDYGQAEKFYKEVLAGDTLNLEYLHILGNIKRIKGEFEEAERYYQKVVALDSTYLESYLKLAQLELAQGDLLFAEGHLKRAEELEPGTQGRIDIYSGLGQVYQRLGKTEQAQESFRNALFFARRFIAEFAGKPIPYLRLGESFFNVGEVDSAIHFYQIAEFLEERALYRGRVLLALGKAYMEKDDLSRAELYLQEVLSLPTGQEEKKEAERLLKSM
jgi:tetratricopeptide (TPR) repeat protein